MPVWNTLPIDQEPEIFLDSWTIYEVSGNRHFVGYSVNGHEGRVSSSIVAFDREKMCGITSSGRVYNLIGEPGYNNDANYVWQVWCYRNQIDQSTAKIVSNLDET